MTKIVRIYQKISEKDSDEKKEMQKIIVNI